MDSPRRTTSCVRSFRNTTSERCSSGRVARAGTTAKLMEIAAQPGFASHRYEDFPFLFTPYWWNTLLKFAPRKTPPPRERAHGDGIMVTPQSPEAFEEMLWTTFFDHLHDTQHSAVLNEHTANPAFEKCYVDHIKKRLLVRGATRYVAKNNYNITRIAYLKKLFPDAEFIIPKRDRESHVASLMRQHERFMKVDARAARHMALAGHFEFGPNRMPIHTGDDALLREIQEAWRRGDEVRGWALLWDAVYGFVRRQLESHPTLKERTLMVRYEELCAEPLATLKNIFAHVQMDITGGELETLAAGLSAPNYPSPLTEAERSLIRQITHSGV